MVSVRAVSVGSVLIFLSLLLSLAVYGLINFIEEPDIIKIKCDETTCTVNVKDGKCYAKIENNINQNFKQVKCDKPRLDATNLTLPCNVAPDEVVIINCDQKNSNKPVKIMFVVMMIILIGSGIIMGLYNFMKYNYFWHDVDNTNIEGTAGNNETQNDQQKTPIDMVNLNITADPDNRYNDPTSHNQDNTCNLNSIHIKNTGSNYVRFDKD